MTHRHPETSAAAPVPHRNGDDRDERVGSDGGGPGDPNAPRELARIGSDSEFISVYGQLRRAAQVMISNERTGVSVQPTALVHEAYLRLRDLDGSWVDEKHYFRTAVRAMRRYLIDRARERNALRRGGDRKRLSIDDHEWSRLDIPILREMSADALDGLDDAVAELERAQPRAAEVAQMRWILGLTIEQVADVLSVSEDTVKRDWRFARAWLRSRLQPDGTTATDDGPG